MERTFGDIHCTWGDHWLGGVKLISIGNRITQEVWEGIATEVPQVTSKGDYADDSVRNDLAGGRAVRLKPGGR